MTNTEFQRIFNELIEELKNKSLSKGLEYSRNKDRFHNFEEGAKLFGITKEKYLLFLLSKHTISINDMVDDIAKGVFWTNEVWKEKITDIILYLFILYAMNHTKE